MKIEKMLFKSEKHEGEELEYFLGTPEKEGTYPLVILMHGAGSRWGEIERLRTSHSMWDPFTKGVSEKAVFVCPHCKWESWFDVFEMLNEFIDFARHMKNIDISRVYLTGYSMGGYASWHLLMAHPEWYAAAMPVCGGSAFSATSAGKRFKDIPIWAFHGLIDPTVACEETLKIIRGINKAGGHAKLSLYPEVAHDAWVPAYSSEETWNWLFSQKKEL